MSPEEFATCRLVDLASITGISKSKWSQYFNNHSLISERTLIKAAALLGMEPHELLQAIDERRKLTVSKKLAKN